MTYLDLYLVRRYKICHFHIVVSYLCIGQNLKNQHNLVLYQVQKSKIFVSVATLLRISFPGRPIFMQFVPGELLEEGGECDGDGLGQARRGRHVVGGLEVAGVGQEEHLSPPDEEAGEGTDSVEKNLA